MRNENNESKRTIISGIASTRIDVIQFFLDTTLKDEKIRTDYLLLAKSLVNDFFEDDTKLTDNVKPMKLNDLFNIVYAAYCAGQADCTMQVTSGELELHGIKIDGELQ